MISVPSHCAQSDNAHGSAPSPGQIVDVFRIQLTTREHMVAGCFAKHLGVLAGKISEGTYSVFIVKGSR
jgi:hypothetical protein